MGLQWRLKRRTYRLVAIVAAGALSFISLAIWLVSSPATADVSLSGPQNCDANAVIYCGATSASQLVTKYEQGDGQNSAASIHAIYSFFGISDADITAMPTTAEAGTVTRSGNVYVGSQEVATQALTAGREDVSGSTKEDVGGTVFYERNPSSSFASSSLNAYVVMSKGVFQFAILSSCGNPIKAVPLPKPTPTTTPKPAPTPAPTAKPAATPKPTPTPASTPAPSGACTNLALSVSATDTQEISAAVTYSVKHGASLKSAKFNWGDNTVSTVPVGQNLEANHVYSQAGTHNVVVTLTFNGSPQPAATTCQGLISTSAPVAPTLPAPTVTPTATTAVTTTAPSQLVNTGVNTNELAGLFIGSTAVGALVFRRVIMRHLR